PRAPGRARPGRTSFRSGRVRRSCRSSWCFVSWHPILLLSSVPRGGGWQGKPPAPSDSGPLLSRAEELEGGTPNGTGRSSCWPAGPLLPRRAEVRRHPPERTSGQRGREAVGAGDSRSLPANIHLSIRKPAEEITDAVGKPDAPPPPSGRADTLA